MDWRNFLNLSLHEKQSHTCYYLLHLTGADSLAQAIKYFPLNPLPFQKPYPLGACETFLVAGHQKGILNNSKMVTGK